jgi:tetratricopeptide (TPR) repeat protein
MEPTASGVLSKTPLAHLVVYCLDKRLRGTLVLRPAGDDDPQVADYVTLVDGLPAKIRVADPIEHLGRILVELGLIDDATYNESLMKLAAGGLHGQILLASGKIDDAGLERALRVQLARKLGHLFGAREPSTTYAYYDGVDFLGRYGGPELFPIDPLPTIWAGIRARPSQAHLESTLERMGDTPLRPKAGTDWSRFDLTRAERDVLDRLRKAPASPNELMRAGVDARTVRLLVYAMLLLKQLEAAARPSPAPGAIRAVQTPAPTPTPAPVAAAARPTTSTSQLIAAVTAGIAPPPTHDSAQHAISLPVKPVSVPPPAGARLSPELEARRKEIVDRAAKIAKENYFQILGLTEAASADDAKNAYFQLVKRWHPDRLPPDLAFVREEVGRVFALVAEAYQTLTDGERRARYVELLKEGGGTPEDQATVQRTLEAAGAFQKADFYLSKGNLAEAETHAKQAYELDPKEVDHIAMWAWVQSQRPERRDTGKYDDLLKMLDAALADAPRNERARYYRGMILKAAGRMGDAMRDFREVAEANPRHVDAVREVRLYAMRHDRERRSKDEGSGSLLGRFIKKK